MSAAALALAGLLVVCAPAIAEDDRPDYDANPGAPQSGPGRRIKVQAEEPAYEEPDQPRRQRDRDGNPPGPRGGPGTNWENPPGPRGGPGTSPDRRRYDRDDNPPGPRGGPGTNWENPPGPRGGPGASPDRRWRGDDNWRYRDRWRDVPHHPRWRQSHYYDGRYWYPHWYYGGWDDSWRWYITLRFHDDRYWWYYDDAWWFWDQRGFCWRSGNPRWRSHYGRYGWRDTSWPRQWAGYHWRFCW